MQEDKVIQEQVEMEEMAFMDVAVAEQVELQQLQDLEEEMVETD